MADIKLGNHPSWNIPYIPRGRFSRSARRQAPRDIWDISLGMISSFDIGKISLGRCPRDILLIYLSSPRIPLGFASWYTGWLEVYQAIYYSFFISPRGILYSTPLLWYIKGYIPLITEGISDRILGIRRYTDGIWEYHPYTICIPPYTSVYLRIPFFFKKI